MDSSCSCAITKKSNNVAKDSTTYRSSERRRERQSESSAECNLGRSYSQCNQCNTKDVCYQCGESEMKTICITNTIRGDPGLPGKDGAPGKDGWPGAPGTNGVPGRDGVDGKDGTNGVDGKDGTNSAAAIIGFSSLTEVAVNTDEGGQPGVFSGVGSNGSLFFSPQAGQIDLTTLANIAPSMPRDGTITSLHAYYGFTRNFDLINTNVTIRAELWTSATFDNIFKPSGIVVRLELNGNYPIGRVAQGTTGVISVPITLGTRYMLVFSGAAIGQNQVILAVGQAGGGLAVS